jgi:hypothetical protein
MQSAIDEDIGNIWARHYPKRTERESSVALRRDNFLLQFFDTVSSGWK